MSGLTAALMLPILVTIFGWFFISRQAEKREFRKEIRERVKELREAADAVDQSCEFYWLEATKAKWPKAAVRLKADLKRLANRLALLEAAGLRYDGADLMAELRIEATGEPFESAKRRRSQVSDSERVFQTASLVQDLVHGCEIAFYRDFPPLKSSFAFRLLGLVGLGGFLASDTASE